MNTCTLCGELAPVTRSAHPEHEIETLGADGRVCFNCDQRMITHITKNFLHVPGAQDFMDDMRSFWAHPAVMTKLMEPDPEPLRVIKGEGQDPRKEDDTRPNLKIVKGWKTITADVQECFCGKPVMTGDVFCPGCRNEKDENDRVANEKATTLQEEQFRHEGPWPG